MVFRNRRLSRRRPRRQDFHRSGRFVERQLIRKLILRIIRVILTHYTHYNNNSTRSRRKKINNDNVFAKYLYLKKYYLQKLFGIFIVVQFPLFSIRLFVLLEKEALDYLQRFVG